MIFTATLKKPKHRRIVDIHPVRIESFQSAGVFVSRWKAMVVFKVLVFLAFAELPAAAPPKKSPVVFFPAGGVFTSNLAVKLSATSGLPVIRFTVDGTEPDETSPEYSTPLSITNTTLVRARTFPQEGQPSSIAGEVYTILNKDLANFSSNIPLLVVNSFGTNIVNERKSEGALQIIGAGIGRAQLSGALDFSGRCLLNIRGRASLRYPKNSFTVKLIDGEGETTPASLLGLPADPDWVLYAPYPDKTLMRDVIAYELHEQMGHWAPRTKFVELFVNQSGGKLSRSHYAGVYVLIERIERRKHRVNIANLKPDDDTEPRITGGYIFKKDHIDPAGFGMGGEGYGAGTIFQNLRAGYPTGIPRGDYIALLGVLRRKLTDDEVRQISAQLAEAADQGDEITVADVEKLINEATLDDASAEDVARVSARLAAGGWPLADAPTP